LTAVIDKHKQQKARHKVLADLQRQVDHIQEPTRRRQLESLLIRHCLKPDALRTQNRSKPHHLRSTRAKYSNDKGALGPSRRKQGAN
jgi:hypothetical protein